MKSIQGHKHGRVPRALREEQLLDVAEALFAAMGYQGASIDGIAEAAGITSGSLFYYFESKEELLVDRAQLKAGETVLVLGAAGGVGSSAIQLGKALGARVIAAASSDEKCALCRSIGADVTINYSRDNLREAIKAATGGLGPNVVYDPVGGEFAEPAFRSIAWRGRYLVVGFASGPIPSIALNLPLLEIAVGIPIGLGFVVVVTTLGLPLGLHLSIKSPVGQIDAVQGVGERGTLEFVRGPPPAAIPGAELVADLGFRHHRGQQAFRRDRVLEIVHRHDRGRAAEVAALGGAVGIENADRLAALAFHGFFLGPESALIGRDRGERLFQVMFHDRRA